MYGNFQLFADGIEVTDYAGNVSWQNTIYELATSLSFEVAKTDTKHLYFYAPVEGSIISIVTNTEIFKGIWYMFSTYTGVNCHSFSFFDSLKAIV